YLKALRYLEAENDLCFVHASPHSPADWYYITDLEDAADSFNFFRERICVTYTYQTRPGERLLVNDGSVGQPRDRNPQASFTVCDSETGFVEVLRVDYPV